MEQPKHVVGKKTNEHMVLKCCMCVDLNQNYNIYGSFFIKR